jgi:biopolymer transport protein ExbD
MPLKTTMDDAPGLNLTPMIDVLFNILIFFLVGTTFAEAERDIKVNVPDSSSTAPLSSRPEGRIVNVYKDGSVSLDDRPMSLAQLTRELSAARSEYEDLSVTVRGEATGIFQNVANAIDAVRSAGIDDLGIAVQMRPQDQ